MTPPDDSTLLDLRGLRCPLPVLKVRKTLLGLPPGAVIEVLTDDPLAALDVPNFLRENGDVLVGSERTDNVRRFTVRRGPSEAKA